MNVDVRAVIGCTTIDRVHEPTSVQQPGQFVSDTTAVSIDSTVVFDHTAAIDRPHRLDIRMSRPIRATTATTVHGLSSSVRFAASRTLALSN